MLRTGRPAVRQRLARREGARLLVLYVAYLAAAVITAF